MLRLLTLTTLYPNACQPTHGIFVENRLRFLLRSGQVASHVIAPVGYVPSGHRVFGRHAVLAGVPHSEKRHGVQVDHPRYLAIPKLGMHLGPYVLYLSVRRHLKKLLRAGHGFDLIDAHYFYPDGVAAAYIAREFGLPFVVTARGSDVIVLPRFAWPRRRILAAASKASGLIAVAGSLKARLVELGVAPDRIVVLRNGVDLTAFRPLSQAAAAARLGLRRRTIASVGHLIPRKGHDFVIRAIADVPDVDLVIVGVGPEQGRLEALVRQLGLDDRVRFVGALAYEDMPWLFSAVALNVLASSHEGWPNVLLEALACGTPVVATAVDGSPDIVSDRGAGRLVSERSPAAIAAAIRDVLAAPPARADTRANAERFSWDATTAGQLELFARICPGRITL